MVKQPENGQKLLVVSLIVKGNNNVFIVSSQQILAVLIRQRATQHAMHREYLKVISPTSLGQSIVTLFCCMYTLNPIEFWSPAPLPCISEQPYLDGPVR